MDDGRAHVHCDAMLPVHSMDVLPPDSCAPQCMFRGKL